MAFSLLSDEAIENENAIQNEIYNAIDEYKSIKFSAGAGAGKTYALIKSLEYILQKYGTTLKNNNQNILCITYTNVATNEIKNRLGNTSIVKVSTIHEQLWALIKDYQKELLLIHKENIEKQNQELTNEVYEDQDKTKEYGEFRELNNKKDFIKLMIANKELYNKSFNKSANDFKNEFNSILTDYTAVLRSVSRFKTLVNKLYKINDYSNAIEEINKNGTKNIIKYNNKYNSDSLHKMRISHDTLLEYSKIIIEKYDLLKRILVNKFPYIMIDEYQDTSELVVQIMYELSKYANQINHKLFIGYFGDEAQNIYDTGIGNKLDTIHKELLPIKKEYNRRSSNNIINLINKIRDDSIKQKTIYTDSECGKVVFDNINNDTQIDAKIEECIKEWGINIDNKLHCLVLKNKLVAKYNKFENIYNKFEETTYYKTGKNYENLNTHLLNNEKSKLGNVQILLFNIIELIAFLKEPQTPINKILPETLYNKIDLSLKDLSDILNLLTISNWTSLYQYLKHIFEQYQTTNNQGFAKIIDNIFNIVDNKSIDGMIKYILEELYKQTEDTEQEEDIKKINELLNISIDEYLSWYNFIIKNETEAIIYHTYHGTKGEEYDNVLVILEDNFKGKDNKFIKYFQQINKNEKDENFNNTKNLLYVAFSRAKINLKVLYIGNDENILRLLTTI